VLDNLKDYAVRAVVNAVDHLGTVAYKLTDLFEQQASEVSTFELKVARLNQVIAHLSAILAVYADETMTVKILTYLQICSKSSHVKSTQTKKASGSSK
jgi:hypothetical protein